MGTLLVRNATVLATMDDSRQEISGGGMFVRDGWIERVDSTANLPKTADEIVDLTDHVVLPGFINAHHHLFQTFDRVLPEGQRARLGGWLKAVYPNWSRLGPTHIALATKIGLLELAKSGCTTVADHQYIWPPGYDQIEAASEIGVRFHLGRGFQNIGRSGQGFAPEQLIENDDDILADCDRLISRYHDPADGAFLRVFVAPSSIRTVTPDLFRQSAEFARHKDVRLHMHIGETFEETEFSLQRFGVHPLEQIAKLGWSGSQAWFAHGVHLDYADIRVLIENGWGLCHCPSSNMRLGSGTSPVKRYMEMGIPVGLGVDGAASNDSSNLLSEIRMALLLSRVTTPASDGHLLDARSALEFATLGGAKLLGRSDIGQLRAGYVADFIAIDLNRVELMGAVHDPVAAVALCAISHVDRSWVHGRPLVEDGEVIGIDMPALIRKYKSTMSELFG